MRAGPLRHRIEIQTRATTLNAAGEPTGTWSTYAEAWAAIWPIRGLEYFSARQEQDAVTHKVRIRYLSGVTPEMRVKFGTRYFDIASVINTDERNIYIDMMAIESL
jgi:SPP1 family predicted phage head-tail adaptor